MKESWISRDYQIGDEHEILTLYKEVNGREMSLEYWNWRYRKSPFGKGIIKLMFDRDKLIGHYAVVPMDVQVQNTLVKAAFSLNTMTHPNYRGHGIFAYLGEEAYRICEQKGVKFVYGFPNSNIYQSRIKKLGWKGFGKIGLLQKNLESRPDAASRAKSICEIHQFDIRVNSLWEKVRANYLVIVPRTKDFLNWRFAEHPTAEYSKYVISDNGILGYMVLKEYSKRNEVKGHIIDMLCMNDKETVKNLLNYAYGYFTEKGVKNLSCWMPEDCFYADILKEEGFIRNEVETYFGVRAFDRKDQLLQTIEQVNNWHLTMGDSDVF